MFSRTALIVAASLLSVDALSHGLIQSPKSRNQLCGVETKPHEAQGTICEQAFAGDSHGGYQFMSVLTHGVGRAGVTPLPSNVCGFDSETWSGGATPWDKPIDWPTQPMSPGRQEFSWNISWGPHFDDTAEFRYWITKPDFQYQVGVPLTWSDFEEEAFCYLPYNDADPGASPDVVADKAAATFSTFCDVPERTGRHVIYAEWGRNHYTFERFHGCVDVRFSSSGSRVPDAESQTLSMDRDSNRAITLRGSDPDGSIVSYAIAREPSNGSLAGQPPYVTYSPSAGYVGEDSFQFTVTDNEGLVSAPAIVTIRVSGEPVNQPPSASFNVAVSGLSVSVDASGSTDAEGDALTYEWRFGDGSRATGVQASHTYASAGTYDISLRVSDGRSDDEQVESVNVQDTVAAALACDYVVYTEWNGGFVASVRLTNVSEETIDGWNVDWTYQTGHTITHGWSSRLTNTGATYTAGNMSWNSVIVPGQTVEFGFQGTKGSESAEIPNVAGPLCR